MTFITVSGFSDDGFITTAFPAARAEANFWVQSSTG
jgi:hypothetical protein